MRPSLRPGRRGRGSIFRANFKTAPAAGGRAQAARRRSAGSRGRSGVSRGQPSHGFAGRLPWYPVFSRCTGESRDRGIPLQRHPVRRHHHLRRRVPRAGWPRREERACPPPSAGGARHRAAERVAWLRSRQRSACSSRLETEPGVCKRSGLRWTVVERSGRSPPCWPRRPLPGYGCRGGGVEMRLLSKRADSYALP
eukprot:scaffold388_cov380-Prasinococcus_capsulatus_cf.AAC.42